MFVLSFVFFVGFFNFIFFIFWFIYCFLNSCMFSRVKIMMNRKSRKRRLMIDFMELSRDIIKFRKEF